ncbi:PAS domain-containing protein [Marinobacter sp. X15-166B]|uniref:PAS domain-containing protein n=1 Tax=Marinobacter sp. X15-166B TaxID=1897620 RepID=UPI00085C7F08|nr:PAS domain-containing protein [Marinobacter sp. X15-166B]OEY65867.1 hypothetical protein BG841_04955 [Marinobacter sp. X15-166B]
MAIPASAVRWTAILWLPAAVFLVGLGTTWFSAYAARSATQALVLKSLHEQEKRLSTVLRSHISQLIAEGQALADFPSDTFALFQHRAGILLGNHHYVMAVEALKPVAAGQRTTVEQALSAEVGEPVRLGRWQRGPSPEPLNSAEQYLIVRWARTQPDALVADSTVGLVATTVPHWRRALDLALREDRITATPITDVRRGGVDLDALRLFIPASTTGLVSLAIDPQEWLTTIYRDIPSPDFALTVHDLSQHAKMPLFQRTTSGPGDASVAVRSEIALGDRSWMLTLTPSRQAMVAAGAAARWRIIISGFLLTVLAAAVTGWLSARLFEYKRQLARSDRRHQQLQLRFDNSVVEREVLHRALGDSEQRSRDLVALHHGFVCELDEQLRIGYISDQVVDLLQSPPAELAQQSFTDRVVPAERTNVNAALHAAREEGSVTRIDTWLQDANSTPVAVTCRFKALIDPINGFTGYRLSAHRRE